MVLRRDDPLVGPLEHLGEPLFLVDANPTVEHLARLIYDYAISQALPVVEVRVWETPTSFAAYRGE
jgi:6-pyruvoyltetrahydropterin/6-carboxytetrahydropterin synthase